MNKPTWIRSKDGKHLAGSIGVGKTDVPTTRREIKNQAKQVKEQDRQNKAQAKIQAKHENMLTEQRVTSLRVYGVLSPYWPGTTQYYKNKKDLAQIAKIKKIKENCLVYNGEDENSPEYKKLLSKIKDADRYDYVTGMNRFTFNFLSLTLITGSYESGICR